MQVNRYEVPETGIKYSWESRGEIMTFLREQERVVGVRVERRAASDQAGTCRLRTGVCILFSA